MQAAKVFPQHRSYLQGLVYRMLGSVVEPEDVIQDAHLRWYKVDMASIDPPGLPNDCSKQALSRPAG